jgi:hypothetical protein
MSEGRMKGFEMESLQFWVHIATIVAGVATSLGVPIGIALFRREKRRERRDREYGTYDALNNDYISYLKLVMEKPHLGLYIGVDHPPNLGPTDHVQQAAMFEIIVSMLERSFLLYSDLSSKVKEEQWIGWHEYIRMWCENPTFRQLWEQMGSGSQYAVGFVNYVNDEMKTCVVRPVTPPTLKANNS